MRAPLPSRTTTSTTMAVEVVSNRGPCAAGAWPSAADPGSAGLGRVWPHTPAVRSTSPAVASAQRALPITYPFRIRRLDSGERRRDAAHIRERLEHAGY